MSEYEQQLQAWKDKHGIGHVEETNPDEMTMAAEDLKSTKKHWCFWCDKEMPVRDMKLVTKRIDPYTQCDEGEGDYIAEENRVRMCPACYEEHYGHNDKLTDAR